MEMCLITFLYYFFFIIYMIRFLDIQTNNIKEFRTLWEAHAFISKYSDPCIMQRIN